MLNDSSGRSFWWSLLLVVLIVFILAFIAYDYIGVRPSAGANGLEEISLPQGFTIDTYAENLGSSLVSYPGPDPGPRMLLQKDGVVYVSIPNKGLVSVLPDRDGNNKADGVSVFISGLNSPHGIDYSEGWFYIAEEDRVIRVRDDDGDLIADADSLEVLIDDLPSGGHSTRTVKVTDNAFYLSIGSSCNVCYEEDERRAAITKCDLDGSNCSIFASGLRNSVGMAFHPVTGQLYATDNGRDWLGDDLPPDEINLIEEGNDYGWPLCYGKNVRDTDFDPDNPDENVCENKTPSLVDLQAHSAPLGLAFYDGNTFPEEYEGDMFVCYHGSWNREVPTGYKVVSIDMDTLEVNDFATGWLKDNGTVTGRPVDVIVAEDGSLLVSDDNAGKIYRISFSE
ncbi:PQQ-dependent sugar dehydrogenase [Methanolobus sp. ZRKC2]|uniref:PQQ-dependent sugar dehydrogenase n=1 Tax=Methanolobus sp. ZRKC2 TaxID=3125783 RepID=UPI0032436559